MNIPHASGYLASQYGREPGAGTGLLDFIYDVN